MAFGFGRDSGPRGPLSGQAPFNISPRPLSPQQPILPSPDSSGTPQFPTPNRTFEAVVRSPSSVATPPVAPSSSQPYAASNRDSSFRWGDRQSSFSGGSGNPSQRNSFPHRLGTSISPKVFPSQNSESSRRPPVQYTEDFLSEPVNDDMEGHADTTFNHHVASQRRQSPFPAVASNHSIINPTASLNKSQRSSISPPKFSSRSGAASDSQYSQRMSISADGTNVDASVTRLPSHSLTKRTRSPPAAGQAFLSSSPLTENDTEREEQAKAKRLARFKTELDEAEPTILAQRGPNVTQNKKAFLMKSMENKNSMDDLSQDYDNEVSPSSSIIVGLCPDMCPAPERGERERKGDLDRYERLDGDRNHTSKILAVKKYNRTAEREAELIRPMPILQKTMDYLLGLLDQPYDDRLLALYNFLWDRMRAIRMDLRMQHIFNLEAITMLEQMIRLHVIAMHELCDFSKGEGFSEGFDAHLNIEQMNKTSVELFQLYDDHRKKGIVIPTEKEFRGYYALLKLDKHPGYKVEPAELSLDLAKMTAEMRQTQEILFARDVARSCRTGNFIAFFRNARKASYLQACLMHAHFSKLRTQALASLHSGLQFNQGVPITHIAKWLGMEGEDIESLLEYHGFSIKEFEEPYMVKSGPFLHDDKDYPTRCSILVDQKKSNTIVEDVSVSYENILPSKAKPLEKDNKNKCASYQHLPTESPLNISVGGDMEIEAVSPLRGSMQVQSAFDVSSGTQAGLLPGSSFGKPFNDHLRGSEGSPRSNNAAPKTFAILQSDGMQERSSLFIPKSSSIVLSDGRQSDKISPRRFSSDPFVFAPQTSSLGLAKQEESRRPTQSSPIVVEQSDFNATPAPLVSLEARDLIPFDSKVASISATSPKIGVFKEELAADKFTNVQEKIDNDDVGCNFDKEVAESKLRLLLRLWMRRFFRKKKLHEENRLAANAALSSLSLGPPLWQIKDKPLRPPNLNVDKAVHERYKKLQESRVRWNISDLVATKLAEKNANSICVCWKVILFSWLHHETHDIEARLDEWLRHKLIAAETSDGLAMSAPGLSVWRKWACNNSGDTACYFSVVKDTTSSDSETKLVGSSAILFPISETVPWDVQRTYLHNLTLSLPMNACIPLLIICGFRREDVADTPDGIVAKLGLEEFDKSVIGSYSVICLNEKNDSGRFHGYFSDQRLKDGLIWLASESSPQPILSCMITRELVSLHLNSCLDTLHCLGSVRVGPNECISAFNEALDQTVNNIVAAAKANPSGWPCPELYLLDESTSEFRAVKKFLPSLGWSSSEEVEPLISALRNCKLAYFSDDLSWLGKRCTIEAEIEEQRRLLQDCLMKYLTQTCNMMHWLMAAKEATLMIQNFTKLELCDTEFQMVPSWILIFRRVFNWQLNSAESFTKKAYILEQTKFDCTRQFLKLDLDVHMNHFRVHSSLDEMVEVSCSPFVSKRVRSSPKSGRNVVARTSSENITAVALPSPVFEENNNIIQNQCVDDSDIHLAKRDYNMVAEDTNKDDRLIQLLKQCDILQDENEKKLSIYF